MEHISVTVTCYGFFFLQAINRIFIKLCVFLQNMFFFYVSKIHCLKIFWYSKILSIITFTFLQNKSSFWNSQNISEWFASRFPDIPQQRRWNLSSLFILAVMKNLVMCREIQISTELFCVSSCISKVQPGVTRFDLSVGSLFDYLITI